MSEEIKLAWHSDVKCPKCNHWMRLRGSSVTDKYYHAHVVCGRCGIHEQLKVPIEQYHPRTAKQIVQEEVVEREPKESVGRQVYGERPRARAARRVKKEED